MGMSTNLEPSLIDLYFDSLLKGGVEGFPRADFEMDYCLQLGGVLERWVSHVVLHLGDDEAPLMQPWFDGPVWSFETHHVVERVQEYLGWELLKPN